MPRHAGVVIPGVPHHVTQRGNYQQDIFFCDDDRRMYLRQLKDSGARHGLRVLAYCLITNHVHLIVVPQQEKSLAAALGRTHLVYAQYIHRLHARVGKTGGKTGDSNRFSWTITG